VRLEKARDVIEHDRHMSPVARGKRPNGDVRMLQILTAIMMAT
jgi:hypothetical protein